MIKKLSLVCICMLLALNIFSNPVKASSGPPVPSADSAVLMNAVTGEILYAKNPNDAYPPASTTKILTTLLTLENCELDEILTVGEGPSQAEGSSIYLLPGEQLTVRDVLYGLNLQSGNDCAEALAEHIAGSVENFAEMMNKRARELGCENSNFRNPSGLYDKDHRTSAKDLALILKELIKYPEYLEIASTMTHIIEPNNKSTETRYVWNKNKLLQPSSKYYYKGALAGKTGYTTQSQHSYVAVAERDGQILIVTLVHDSSADYYQDTINLFNYGFSNFKTNNFINKNEILTNYTLNDNTTIPVIAGDNFFYTTYVNSDSKASFKLNLLEETLNSSSIKAGDKIGTADIFLDGKTIGSMEVFSGADHVVEQKMLFHTASVVKAEDKSINLNLFYIIGSIPVFLLILIATKNKHILSEFFYKFKRKRADN
ncbi:D-alanyl-D-alanine carboxypeptidase family protein [Clostridium thermarum]|uniref:D-alanyl-D-alanine carboxypeptidase family protein n=1 Tax=Clostridium thermarum TaxID=1716543 RepID=UPI0011247FC8|nr:D-alanyl-D-alanine carboxypeptidase family protein [Clostridium thermarum]